MPFISSFIINKVNSFPTLRTHFLLTFLSNLFIEFKVKLHTNPGKLPLAKRIAIFVSTFCHELLNQEPKDLPD